MREDRWGDTHRENPRPKRPGVLFNRKLAAAVILAAIVLAAVVLTAAVLAAASIAAVTSAKAAEQNDDDKYPKKTVATETIIVTTHEKKPPSLMCKTAPSRLCGGILSAFEIYYVCKRDVVTNRSVQTKNRLGDFASTEKTDGRCQTQADKAVYMSYFMLTRREV